MTVQVIQMFTPTQLSTAAVTLYTFSAGGTGAVLSRGRIRFVNNSASATTVTAYDIPSGGSASATTTFCPAKQIVAGDTLDVDVPVIALGGTIQALSPAGTAVVAHALDGVIFAP
jgi:hypothetical protein